MAQSEREARLERQREQLRGLDISGPMEPARSLYDVCANMIDKERGGVHQSQQVLVKAARALGVKPAKEIQLDATKSALVEGASKSCRDTHQFRSCFTPSFAEEIPCPGFDGHRQL